MNINAYAIPLLFGFVNSWVVAFLLIARSVKTNRYSDRVFAGLLLCSSFLLLPYMFGYLGINILWNELEFFPTDPTFLLGPLFYFYLESQINTDFRIKGKRLLHFIPFALYSFYHLVVFFQGKPYVMWFTDRFPMLESYWLVIMFISIMVYLLITVRLYQRYRLWLKTEYADGDPFSLRWFKNFLTALLVLSLVMWSFTFLNMAGVPLDYNHNVWQYILLAIVLSGLAVEGYAQKQPLYMNYAVDSAEEPKAAKDETKGRVETEEFSEVYPLKGSILHLMDVEKLYLSTDLSLTYMASYMKISKSELSGAINQIFGKNFSQFVNEYRVRHVCAAIDAGEHQKLSLLGIAMNAGFNSKATFNRVFKEQVGVTPQRYAERLSRE